MGKAYTTKSGKRGVWLSPKDKVTRYCRQIKKADGKMKDTQLAYRSGYIAAHQDHTDIFLLKEGKQDKVREFRNKRHRFNKKK